MRSKPSVLSTLSPVQEHKNAEADENDIDELARYIREQEHKNLEIKDKHITALERGVTKDNLETQPKSQPSVKLELAESDKGKGSGVTTSSKTVAKPTKSNWKALGAIVGVIWLLYETIPQVKDDIQRCWRGETYRKNWLGGSNESRSR